MSRIVPEVRDRYIANRKPCATLEIWKPNRQVCHVKRGYTLRMQAPASFRLRWSQDDWQTAEDTPSHPTRLGIHYVDISVPSSQRPPIRFTFFWTATDHWEGRDYEIAVDQATAQR
jgi:glucoamylase